MSQDLSQKPLKNGVTSMDFRLIPTKEEPTFNLVQYAIPKRRKGVLCSTIALFFVDWYYIFVANTWTTLALNQQQP